MNDQGKNNILSIISENIGPEWKSFAKYGLDVSDEEIAFVDGATDPSVPHEQCWEVLNRWKHSVPAGTLTRRLSDALKATKHYRLADIVLQTKQHGYQVDQVLAPHVDREETLIKAMYLVADICSQHWRELAHHLNLERSETQAVERNFGPYRPRDKCMYVLYKWRQRVGLKDFKISSLVQALRATGLHAAADQVIENSTQGHKEPSKLKTTSPSQTVLVIGVEEITIDNYVPTPSSTPGPYGSVPDTPRPKSTLSQNLLQDYALNKIFFHLLDLLEHQDQMRMEHPLLHFLRMEHAAEIRRISRKEAAILINFSTVKNCQNFQQLVKSNKLDYELSQHLVTSFILSELGVRSIKIKAYIS